MGSGEPGEVHWSGNQLWEDVAGVPLRVESKLEESAKVVWVMIVSSLVLEGSKVEVITYKGNRRKVRILEYVIQSILSLKERIVSARTQRKRGLGKLIGAKMIGNKDNIVREIAWIIAHSSECVSLHVLSWNVLGLGSVTKRKFIQILLRQLRIEMVVFLETKLKRVSVQLVKHVWWLDIFSFVFAPSVGLLGGIIVVRDPSKFASSSSWYVEV
ncbi:hypothetical protein V6N13_088834 [Hibiscus sabdariffa]